MEKLLELETSVSKLSENEYAKFRKWFWQYENERWDKQFENDVEENKLEEMANKALEDFKHGKFKEI